MSDLSERISSMPPPSSHETKSQPRHTFFFGWWVVAASAVGIFWGVPVTIYSFSVFFKPLMQEFHVGRAAISLGFTLHLLAVALTAPVLGWLVNRYGARKVILRATVMFGAILVANKAFSGNIWQFYFFYLALGLLLNGVGPIPYGNVVSHWFDRRRGLALGLTMLGIGFGAMIIPSLTQQLIAKFGLQAAYAILGGAVLLISVPVVAAFLKEKPQELGLLPDGALPASGASPSDTFATGLSRNDALHSRVFWLMVCAFFLVGVSVQGCLVHMTAMLLDRGVTAQTAALGSSLVGAAVLMGRVGTGYLLDRFFGPYVSALFFGGVTLGVGLLLTRGTTSIVFAGAFLVGLGLGAEVDIIAYLISRYFGLRCFAEIYSVAIGFFALAGAFGPLLMGKGFDITGSYNGALIAFLIATLIAVVLMTRLGPYRYRAAER